MRIKLIIATIDSKYFQYVKQLFNMLVIFLLLAAAGCVPTIYSTDYLRAHNEQPESVNYPIIVGEGDSCDIFFYPYNNCADQTINGANIKNRPIGTQPQFFVEVPPGQYEFKVRYYTGKLGNKIDHVLMNLNAGKIYKCTADQNKVKINEFDSKSFMVSMSAGASISIKQWVGTDDTCAKNGNNFEWKEVKLIKNDAEEIKLERNNPKEAPLTGFKRNFLQTVFVPADFFQKYPIVNFGNSSNNSNKVDRGNYILRRVSIKGTLVDHKNNIPLSGTSLYYYPLTDEKKLYITYYDGAIENPSGVTDANGNFAIVIPSVLAVANKVFTLGAAFKTYGSTQIWYGRAIADPVGTEILNVDGKIGALKINSNLDDMNLGIISISRPFQTK